MREKYYMKEEEILAKNIRKYRESFKLTQGELAEMLNYSDKTISKWERAESIPDIFTLKKIAQIFRINIEDLLNESSTQTKKKTPAPLWHRFTLEIILISVIFAYVLTYLILCITNGPKLAYLYMLSIYLAASLCLAIFIYIRCFKHRLNILTLSLTQWFAYAGLILSLLPLKGINVLFIILLPTLSQVFIVFYCNFRNKVIKINISKTSKNTNA